MLSVFCFLSLTLSDLCRFVSSFVPSTSSAHTKLNRFCRVAAVVSSAREGINDIIVRHTLCLRSLSLFLTRILHKNRSTTHDVHRKNTNRGRKRNKATLR